MISICQGQFGYDCCWVLNLAAETNTSPLRWHHSLGWSASYLVTGWLHWTTFITKRAGFFLTGIDRYFSADEEQQWAHAHGIHWSYHIPQHPDIAGFTEQWNGLLKIQLQYLLLLTGDILKGWGEVLQETVYALNQCPIYGAISPIARIHRSRNQGVEIGVTSLTTLSDPLTKFLLFLSVSLCSAGLEVLVVKGGMLPSGDTTLIPLNFLPGHSGLLMPLNQQAKKGDIVLAGVIDPDYQREIWTATPQWRKGKVCLEYRRSPRVSLSKTMPCGQSQWKTTRTQFR